MAASALPCAPMAISFGHGAIYRGLQKAKEAEQNSNQKEKTPERKDQAGEDHHLKEAAKDTNDNHEVDALADANAGEAVSLDEHVDVPLDTPTKDESADPMDFTGQPLLQRKQSRDNEADGSSTPRQSNGHARFADFLPLHEHVVKNIPQGRVAQSSSSSWADLITSATDHTDEHVTK